MGVFYIILIRLVMIILFLCILVYEICNMILYEYYSFIKKKFKLLFLKLVLFFKKNIYKCFLLNIIEY